MNITTYVVWKELKKLLEELSDDNLSELNE